MPQGLYTLKTIVVWSVVHKSNVCCVLYHVCRFGLFTYLCEKDECVEEKKVSGFWECDILYFINVSRIHTHIRSDIRLGYVCTYFISNLVRYTSIK